LTSARRAEHCHTTQRDLCDRRASLCGAAAARCESDNDAAAYPQTGYTPHTQTVFYFTVVVVTPPAAKLRVFSPARQQATRAGVMAESESGRKRDLAEITSSNYPGERLMPCRNPLLDHERTRKRRELLDATERKLLDMQARARRDNKPLRGKDKIALTVGVDVNHYKQKGQAFRHRQRGQRPDIRAQRLLTP
jgi:hypothetical protein